MSIKPKEILVNLPIVLLFNNDEKVVDFASSINMIMHGKLRIKCEVLGKLGEKSVGLLYLHRNDEYHELRRQFLDMIEKEEIETYYARA